MRIPMVMALCISASLGIGTLPAMHAVAASGNPCGPPIVNPVACENTKPGTAQDVWDVGTSTDLSILGFATDQSVNVGQTVHFKINTTVKNYTIDIYRVGYYQGNGARFITSINPSASLPQSQPACLTNAATGLVDCGNWAESASWAVPSTAVSGVYFALLTRPDTLGQSQIIFVVRNDASHSDLLFQTADSTWQAYNTYGGNSLYGGTGPGVAGAAYKVSYNRPVTTRNYSLADNLFYAEYPAIQFMEQNGYDVSYFSGIDAARFGTLIQNHKTYVTAGHDEYWSGPQRANVTAARDAGVNLIFMSGNEVFWKTRWEASIDGTNTPYRTMVAYKETHANAVIDPADPPTWTGSWRDPRFSPPADGGQAENGLTGQIWTINEGSGAIQVPAKYAGLRFWRNTSVASLTGNQVATLAGDTLGYEWDEEPDNGFRPAGLFDLSSTTLSGVSRLTDYGTNISTGTATHNMSLYRASSGALVFGAGTVQWSWGLTDIHDGLSSGDTFDARIQQATINLLADMSAQPATLMSGMVAATKSADTAPPTSTITSPAAGTTFTTGQAVTISGTAHDNGGGVIAAVEVSTDNGTTWHRANGLASWTYSWQAGGAGNVVIKSRAVDDSANLETPSAGAQVTVNCPCSIWNSSVVPSETASTDGSAIEVGVKFLSDVDSTVTGVKFYKGAGNTGTHVGNLWTATGALLASVTFTGETASGWQQANFSAPVTISHGVTYVVSYFAPTGHYADTNSYFYPPLSPPPVGGSVVDSGPIHALRNGVSGSNGVYQYNAGSTFPTNSYQATNYWVDVLYTPGTGSNTLPPAVTSVSPSDGASNVPTTASVTATFNESISSSSLAFTLTNPSGGSVAATVSYNDPSRTATLQPTAALAQGTLYSASVQASDAVGNRMASPKTWSFLTTGPRVCTCTVFGKQIPSGQPAGDTDSVNLGVKFRSDITGLVTGVRFYKGPGNTGTHVGSLWSSTGTLLATATFGNESASGWQNVGFSTPVSIAAHTTYVASYLAPAGHYNATLDTFLTSGIDSPPLHALATGVDGPNGVYMYGSGNAFPNNSFRSANYWVDVAFEPTPSSSSQPTVTSESPADRSIGAGVSAPVTATFNVPVTNSSIVLRDEHANTVAGSMFYDPVSHTASFVAASPLQYGSTYQASATASDLSSTPMAAPATWTFTTGLPPCPCTIWPSSAAPGNPDSGDGSAIELGVKFTSDVNGVATGVRFYKAGTNTGTHIGNLWSSSGTLLASAVFTGESASGWQQVAFSGAVPITAGATYIASYFTPTGHYSSTPGAMTAAGVDSPPLHAPSSGSSGGNGVYNYGAASAFPANSNGANYWVDVTFASSGATDTTAPTVSATSPASGATGVSPGASVTATFSEAVAPASIAFTVTPSGGSAIGGSVSYNLSNRTATLTPAQGLSPGTSYTASVRATDLYGNAMAAPVTWSFGVQPLTCPCSVFPASATPGSVDSGDGSSIEVGMKFRSDVNAHVTAIRFYKAAANTGTHTGNLWTTAGVKLATVTFTGESASGWQTATLASPVAITAGTTYIVSYFTPTGHYSATAGGFLNSGVDNPPLHGLANGVDGADGVFNYGPASAFPSSTYNGGNYWVDVVISTP